MNAQVTERDAGRKRPFDDPDFARAAGAKGTAERERRRMERIDSGREHLENAYADVCLRAAKLATGTTKLTPLEWAAMKDLMDRVGGQATQKIETLNREGIEEAYKRLTEER